MDNLNAIWGLPSSNSRATKIEKYDYPVVTLLPTPTEKGKGRQINFNAAALTALGITKDQRKVAFGRTPDNNTFLVQALDAGTLKVTGANNVNSKPWHEYLCNLVNGTSVSTVEVEFALQTNDAGYMYFTSNDIIFTDTIVENVEELPTAETITPNVEIVNPVVNTIDVATADSVIVTNNDLPFTDEAQVEVTDEEAW